MASRNFGDSRPKKPHLTSGGGGIAGEVTDLRADTEAAFAALEAEVDPLTFSVVVTEAGVVRTMSNADNGRIVVTSEDTDPIVVTIPTGLTPGVSTEYVQGDGGQIQIVAGGGLTLLHGATFDPFTAEEGSTLVVTVLTSITALVRGDLAAAT